MILIGQYDSPFVRRVAIALRLYAMAYEHRPWSTFADADRIAQFNPLRRVPALILDSGEVLIDSAAILDHLDEVAGRSRALIAASGDRRRNALKVCALATGLADKAVSLIYEQVLHQTTSNSGSPAAEARYRTRSLPSKRVAGRRPRHSGSAQRLVTPTLPPPAH
jgi:glutathione S-transferase